MNIPGLSAITSQIRGGNAAQEATETPAQTKAEAAKGDQQAALKLAALNAVSAASGATNLPESTGKALNKVA